MAGRRRNRKLSSAKSGGSKALGALHCNFKIYYSVFVVVSVDVLTFVDAPSWLVGDGWVPDPLLAPISRSGIASHVHSHPGDRHGGDDRG